MDTTTLLIIVLIVLLLVWPGTLVLSNALTGNGKRASSEPSVQLFKFRDGEHGKVLAQVTPPGQSRARPVESKRSRVTCWRAKSIASARS
jgi:hypothetical protein